MSPSTRQLRQQFKGTQDKKKEVRPDFPAWIGHSDGTTINVDGRPLYVWARTHQVNGRLMQVYNRAVLPRFDQPVRVGYRDDTPNRLEILSLNTEALPLIAGGLANSAQLAVHALQHDLKGGDTDWIQSKRLTPLRPRPQTTADMTIYVEAGTYPFGSVFNRWDGGSSSDMTAHIPSTAGNALYRLVYIDGATNVLAYVNTAEFAADPFISRSATIAAAIPVGVMPIAAVYLFNGQTTIDEDENFDIRILFSPSPGSVAGGGGSGVLWANVLIVATSGGDHTTIGAAITAASSGDLILVAPGTYAENLTGKAGVYVRAMGQSQSVVIAPASGVPLTLPASGTVTFEQVRLTPPASEVGVSFPSASTAVFLLHDSFVDANAAASIDASTAGATGKLTIRDSVIEGDVNTKAITELHEVVIQGDLNQSASAGNLTIYGGAIQTDFAHITGSTIKLIDLPKIDGTISGTGTITGPYITSTGAVTFSQAVTISTLTATRVPFAGAAGLLTDDANLTFVTGTGVLNTFALDIGSLAALSFSTNTLIVGSGFSDNVQIKPAGSVQAEFDAANSLTKFLLYDVDVSAGALLLGGTTRISNAGAATFASVTDSGLTATRVTFAGASGLLADSANFTFTTGTGQLALVTTGSGAGLLIGGDTQIYRSSANVMRSPDFFQADGGVGVGVDDTTQGVLHIYGQATGSAEGGEFRCYLAADHDTTIPYYAIDAQTDDFRFFSQDAVVFNQFRYSEGAVFNEGGNATQDFRIEGDSLTHMFFTDATGTTENIALFAAAAPNWQTMDRGIFFGNTSNAPTGNPTSGGFMYSSAGAGTWLGSSGTSTAFGPAGPHCGNCGYDFWRVNYENKKWGAVLRVCGWCDAEYKEGPESVMDKLTEKELSEILH